MRNTKNIKKNNIFLVYFYLLDLLTTKEIKCVKFQKEHLEITFPETSLPHLKLFQSVEFVNNPNDSICRRKINYPMYLQEILTATYIAY